MERRERIERRRRRAYLKRFARWQVMLKRGQWWLFLGEEGGASRDRIVSLLRKSMTICNKLPRKLGRILT